ncbi:MAG: hypothetical protein QM730_20960 [Anaerolineales bacterium]
MQPVQRRILYSIILLLGLAWIWVSADRSGDIHRRADSRSAAGLSSRPILS